MLDLSVMIILIERSNFNFFFWLEIRNPDSSSCILTAVDEIEDNLYYFNDVISAGVPELGRLITDNILELLIFPLLLPSLKEHRYVS